MGIDSFLDTMNELFDDGEDEMENDDKGRILLILKCQNEIFKRMLSSDEKNEAKRVSEAEELLAKAEKEIDFMISEIDDKKQADLKHKEEQERREKRANR